MSKELFQQLVESKIKRINEPRYFSLLKINIDADSVYATQPDSLNKIIYSAVKHIKKGLRNADSCTLSNNEVSVLLPNTSTTNAGRAGLRIISMLKIYFAKKDIVSFKISFSLSSLPLKKSNKSFWRKEVASLGESKPPNRNSDIKTSYF